MEWVTHSLQSHLLVCSSNTHFSGDRAKVTQLGTASVIPTEQDAPSQRAEALKRSLESWVLGSSSCTGALGAMQLLNGLFLMEYTMRPWGGVISGLRKAVSGHPNQVSMLKRDVERMGEVCRRAVRMTRGLKNKKKTACHSKPIAWNCLTEGS